ncbi:MAG: polysaccharide biosynthesis tyrosine autokinase [bacterium]
MNKREARNNDLLYYTNLLYRRRLVIIIASIITFAIVLTFYALTPPEYIAEAKILVESSNFIKQAQNSIVQNNETFYMETLPWLMRSEPVIRQAVKSLGIKEGTKAFENACLRILHDLHMKNLPNSSIFTVYIQSTDPVFAAKATNAVIESYIQFQNQQREKRIETITAELGKGLDSLKRKIQESQEQLINYAEKHLLEENMLTLSSLGIGYTGETQELSELQIKSIMLEIELSNLLQKYKDRYPLVIQKRNELNVINSKINAIRQSMLKGYKKRIKYMMLSNELALNKDLYNILTKELKELNLLNNINYTTITIIQNAGIPTHPVNRNILHWLLLGLGASIVIGIFSGMIADQLNTGMKNEKDIELFIKYPVIGSLPFIKELKTVEPSLFINTINNLSSKNYLEALRLLRTNLRYSIIKDKKTIFLVTSTSKNEGKTTVCVSLAYILSITGAKVLIVDADVKNPTIHKFFNNEITPGFTELLIDEQLDIMNIVKPSNYDGLYFLTSGRQPPNFPELLDSSRIKVLLNSFKQHFDYIIIDTAPIHIIADALILSPHVDGVLFIVKVNSAPRTNIKYDIELLKSVNANIKGIILTRKMQ